MGKRYRYIISNAKPSDALDRFSLLAGNVLGRGDIRSCSAIRITIPDTLKLTKWSCDDYSTADCDCSLLELDPVVVVRINGKLTVMKDATNAWFKGQPIDNWLEEHEYRSYPVYGYITKDQYRTVMTTDRIWRLGDKLPKEIPSVIPNTIRAHADTIKKVRALLDENDIANDFIPDDVMERRIHHFCAMRFNTNWKEFDAFDDTDKEWFPDCYKEDYELFDERYKNMQ